MDCSKIQAVLEEVAWEAASLGACQSWVCEEVFERRWSVVARLECATGGQRCVLKVTKDTDWVKYQAEGEAPGIREARRVEEVRGVLRASGLEDTVPRVLGVTRDGRGIVLTELEGTGLNAWVESVKWGHDHEKFVELCSALLLLGRWLRALQEGSARGGDASEVGAAVVANIETVAIDLQGSSRWRRLAVEAHESSKRWLRAQAGRRTSSVLVHGDFGPWNVLWDGRRIGVIDFLGMRRGYPCEDYYSLRVYFDDLRWRVAVDKRRVAAAWRAMALDGTGCGDVGREEYVAELRDRLTRVRDLGNRRGAGCLRTMQNRWLQWRHARRAWVLVSRLR